jgi:hypothetical protein
MDSLGCGSAAAALRQRCDTAGAFDRLERVELPGYIADYMKKPARSGSAR